MHNHDNNATWCSLGTQSFSEASWNSKIAWFVVNLHTKSTFSKLRWTKAIYLRLKRNKFLNPYFYLCSVCGRLGMALCTSNMVICLLNLAVTKTGCCDKSFHYQKWIISIGFSEGISVVGYGCMRSSFSWCTTCTNRGNFVVKLREHVFDRKDKLLKVTYSVSWERVVICSVHLVLRCALLSLQQSWYIV
jgi:hypothetical protein